MTAITTEKRFTFEEYCTYDDGTGNHRYELVNGRLELMNPPTFRHLLIADSLRDTLKAEIKRLDLPWICLSEAGIRTGWRTSRLADVLVLEAEQVRECLDESAICQIPPILAIEIVSPDSIKRDYRYKRSEYAALGVPEYWIIDPLKCQITILILDEGLYEETIYTSEQKIVSSSFSEISLSVQEILSV
jgi:Uma2 family endonuclease